LRIKKTKIKKETISDLLFVGDERLELPTLPMAIGML
jgi:hypothetical protein